jgi:hypothetical protein
LPHSGIKITLLSLFKPSKFVSSDFPSSPSPPLRDLEFWG